VVESSNIGVERKRALSRQVNQHQLLACKFAQVERKQRLAAERTGGLRGLLRRCCGLDYGGGDGGASAGKSAKAAAVVDGDDGGGGGGGGGEGGEEEGKEEEAREGRDTPVSIDSAGGSSPSRDLDSMGTASPDRHLQLTPLREMADGGGVILGGRPMVRRDSIDSVDSDESGEAARCRKVSIDSLGHYNESTETYIVDVPHDEDAEDAAAVEVDDVELLALGSSRRSSVEGDDDNSCVHLQAVVKWSTWGSKLDQWTVHYVD